MKKAKLKTGLRTVSFWAIYDPATRKIIETFKYKYQAGMPSKDTRYVLIELRGTYMPPGAWR